MMSNSVKFGVVLLLLCGIGIYPSFGEQKTGNGDGTDTTTGVKLDWTFPEKLIQMIGLSKKDLPPKLQKWIGETVARLQKIDILVFEDEHVIGSMEDFRNYLLDARDGFEDFAGNDDFMMAANELIAKLTSADVTPVLKVMTEEHLKELAKIVKDNRKTWAMIAEKAAGEMTLKKKEHLKILKELKNADMSNANEVEKGLGKKALEIMEWLLRATDHHTEL